MKRRLVYRYTCDFCKKANCSAAAISKHEKSCTNNPDRVCGYCRAAAFKQMPIEELKAAFALDVAAKVEADDYEITCGVDHLEEITVCPACTLAAIRQTPHDGVWVSFDFKAESKAFWAQVNSDANSGCYPY